MWVDTVTECGQGIMAAWRKEDEDVAKYREEETEQTALGKLKSCTKAWNLRSDTN